MSAYRCEECGFDGPLSKPCRCEVVLINLLARGNLPVEVRPVISRLIATRAALAEKPIQNFSAYRWAKWARSELTRVRAERDAALARVAELEKAPAGVAVHLHVTPGALEFAQRSQTVRL